MAVCFDNVLDNGKTQPCSANFFGMGSASICPIKSFKNAGKVLLGNANTIVFNDDIEIFIRILQRDLQHRPIFFARIFNGVTD